MKLPKLRIMNIYLLKPKWPEMNTGKAHFKGECPQKDLLILEDHKRGRENRKNSSSRKKDEKKWFNSLVGFREGRILRKKFQKIPKNTEDR
jgi:hypothetical protein